MNLCEFRILEACILVILIKLMACCHSSIGAAEAILFVGAAEAVDSTLGSGVGRISFSNLC